MDRQVRAPSPERARRAQTRSGGEKMSEPTFVYVTYIVTTPEKLWQALTDGAFTRQYWFGTSVESDWIRGSRVIFRSAAKCTTPARFWTACPIAACPTAGRWSSTRPSAARSRRG